MTTRPLFERVERCLGEEGLVHLVTLAGESRPLEEVRDESVWHSYTQMRALLEAGAVLLEGRGGLEALGLPGSMLTRTTMPEVTTAVARFGSPETMIAADNPAAAVLMPALRFDAELLGPGHVRYQWNLVDDLEPFPELCALLRGMLPAMVRLFGCRMTDLRVDACQCWGDDRCAHEVWWETGDDLGTRLDAAQVRGDLAELRLDAYRRSVEDLVSAADLDTALTRIVHSLSHSVQATSVVLAVGTNTEERFLFVAGVDENDARRILADPGDAHVIEVASTRRSYGRLVVCGPPAFIELEVPSLTSFASLAASALESAYAVEQARRQARKAEALLALSRSITELGTVREIGAKVVDAVPALVDCDRAYVVLSAGNVGEVIGCTGLDEASAAELQARSFFAIRPGLDELWFEFGASDHVSSQFPGLRRAAAKAGMNVLVDDEVLTVAVSVVDHPERLVDDPQLGELLSGLAAHASVAVRNARLVEKMRHQSLHDPLTGLPNRTLVLDRAEQMLARARRTGGPLAALFIDLDGFKEINDTLGHAVGDELLAVVAERLRGAVRASDTVGRLGGDEFVVLAEGSSLEDGVEAVTTRILDVLREPVVLPGRDRPLVVTASIGAAVGERDTAGDLLRDADIALYRAKAVGKSCAQVFESAMADDVRRRATLVDDLTGAVGREELFVQYQPVVELRSGRVTGVEALLRWAHPARGVLLPNEFVPSLEQSGLIVDVGRWVLQESCRHAAAWRDAGEPLEVAVNASVRQLERPEFVDDVRDALVRADLPASSLMIEITETAIMHDADAAMVVLAALKELGVRISIDDFGTGYCSLAYLSQFPVDALKIDRVFVDGITRSRSGAELAHTLVRLGRALDLTTYAEGIETSEQLQRLRAEGCDLGQGFLFAAALPPEDVLAFVTSTGAVAAIG